MRVNTKNCPAGEFLFAAVIGQGVKNEDASTRKEDVYEYKVTLEIDEKTAGPLMDEIDDFIEDNAVKGCELTKVPYQTSDNYDGIPVGKVWLAAKCRTTYINKDDEEQDAKVSIFDTRGDKCNLPDGVGIGKGSTGKVFGNISVWDRIYEYGATLWLTGVQIGDFVPYEFEDAPEEMEGSFKGFNTPALEKEESAEEEAPKERTRKSRRGGNTESTEEEKPTRGRRSRRS